MPRLTFEKKSSTHLANLLEFWLILVEALPRDSRIGLICRILSSMFLNKEAWVQFIDLRRIA